MTNLAKIQLKKIARPRTVALADLLESGNRQGRDLDQAELMMAIRSIKAGRIMVEI